MDDLEEQLARIGEHRDAQLAADELTTPSGHDQPRSRRRAVLVAAVSVAVVAVGAVWSARSDDSGSSDTAADVTIDDLDPPTEITTPVQPGAQQFESRLSYRVALQADWEADTTPLADNWFDSLVGEDGEFFRARVFDRPDRSSFVDAVDEFVPSLAEAAREMAGLFPLEFGTNPMIETATIDGLAGYRIQPSPDADFPGTVTYLFDAPERWSRFIELAVDAAHESEVMDSLVWLSEPAPPGRPSEVADIAVFVLPDTAELALFDSQAALSERPNDGPTFSTFAYAGSADDDADGPRILFGIADATGVAGDDVTPEGIEIAVGDRSFRWVSEGENQRTYVGLTPDGTTIAMATLNVDEAAAVRLLTDAETLADGGVVFGDRAVPDGWVDTGTSTTQLQFIAGATGTSTPIGGTRDLYGDPASAVVPSWDENNGGLGVTLSTWPVTGNDPESEARYSLDGEVEIEVRRVDGSITTGFASALDSEFFEFVVWQDGTSWLALSRLAGNPSGVLSDLAATVREADIAEIEQLTSLREE